MIAVVVLYGLLAGVGLMVLARLATRSEREDEAWDREHEAYPEAEGTELAGRRLRVVR